MLEVGAWKRTPRWRVLFGWPAWRRSHTYAHVGGIFVEWEYADRDHFGHLSKDRAVIEQVEVHYGD